MITSNNNLGETLRGLRKGSKFSQEKLAEEMGVDPKTISNLENGVTSLSSTMVHKYMEVFHCDANTLFCISKESTSSVREKTAEDGSNETAGHGTGTTTGIEVADEDMAEIISIDHLLSTVDPVKREYFRNTIVMMITEFPA